VGAVTRSHRHHGRHSWAQPGDRPDRLWVLRFDDPDRREMTWTGEDGEALAIAAYRLYAPTWNCTLLAAVAALDLIDPPVFPAESGVSVLTAKRSDSAPAPDEPKPIGSELTEGGE